MKKAVVYLRVSTEEQAEKGFSIQAQRKECIEKAKALGCSEVREYCEEGVSGTILERPMLLKALEAIKSERVDFFICYEPSRLSRNAAHQLILVDEIKKNHVQLVFVRSSFEDTAEGRLQITIMAAVDEYERARLKFRTELGKIAKANQRLLTHNPNIYGYTFDKDTDTLKINQEQADIIHLMYRWLLEEKLGPSKIADRLNEFHIPSMRGKPWSRVATNRILNNFSYTGTMYIQRYDTKEVKLNKFRKKEEKTFIKEKPMENWIPIKIPSIIDIDTWEKAQTILKKSKRIFNNKTSDQYLLSGLLKCGICGGTFFGKSIQKGGKIYNKYYCCSNKYNYSLEKEHRCKSRLHSADELERLIWNKAKAWILNKDEIIKVLLIEQSSVSQNTSRQYINHFLEGTAKEKDRILRLFQKGYIKEEELDSKLQELDNQKESLWSSTIYTHKNRDISEYNAAKLFDAINSNLDKLQQQSKNKVLHSMIKEIEMLDKTVKLKVFIPIYIAHLYTSEYNRISE